MKKCDKIKKSRIFYFVNEIIYVIISIYGGFMNTIEKVKQLIAEQLCISVDEIKDDANVIEDLGADSLDVVELLMSFEDEFNVSIPDEKLEELKTIPQIVKVIDEFKQN